MLLKAKRKSKELLKKHSESYHKPTPKKWRKIGDSILLVGTGITAISAAVSLSPWVIVAAAIMTTTGKIITNFTTE